MKEIILKTLSSHFIWEVTNITISPFSKIIARVDTIPGSGYGSLRLYFHHPVFYAQHNNTGYTTHMYTYVLPEIRINHPFNTESVRNIVQAELQAYCTGLKIPTLKLNHYHKYTSEHPACNRTEALNKFVSLYSYCPNYAWYSQYHKKLKHIKCSTPSADYDFDCYLPKGLLKRNNYEINEPLFI